MVDKELIDSVCPWKQESDWFKVSDWLSFQELINALTRTWKNKLSSLKTDEETDLSPLDRIEIQPVDQAIDNNGSIAW